MLQIARNLFGLIGALVLMAILGVSAFVIWRSNPDVNIAVFLGTAGIIYTMIILLALHR